MIKNWDQQQCDKRMVLDAKNKMDDAKVIKNLIHIFCILEESPKETNNGCFQDEKKHIDLDGLDLLPADEATSPLLLCHPLRQKERRRPRYVFWR